MYFMLLGFIRIFWSWSPEVCCFILTNLILSQSRYVPRRTIGDLSILQQTWDERGKKASLMRKLWRNMAAGFGKAFPSWTGGFVRSVSQVGKEKIHCAKCLDRLLNAVNGRGSFGRLSRGKVWEFSSCGGCSDKNYSTILLLLLHQFFFLKIYLYLVIKSN